MTDGAPRANPVPLAELKRMTKRFRSSGQEVVACRDINLQITKGESLGIVGESGSGKSTLIRILQLLIPPTEGQVYFEGTDLTRLSARRLRTFRKKIQFVAQDPYGSLFPNLTIGQNIAEPLEIHGVGDRRSRRELAAELMETVGLSLYNFHSFPHELSGGQQQRVAIARALALYPQMIVLDEAVSSLDVSIQAQILNLLQGLKEERELTYVFVSHNLAVIRLMCEQTAVMYLGRIVEQGETERLFTAPSHPYTRALISAIPAFTEDGVTLLGKSVQFVTGVSGSKQGGQGCAYHPRCPFATSRCREETPELRTLESAHQVACHYAETMADSVLQ
jgi:oligopeptide/dipeptide ABC transporter ATP-binding protein